MEKTCEHCSRFCLPDQCIYYYPNKTSPSSTCENWTSVCEDCVLELSEGVISDECQCCEHELWRLEQKPAREGKE